MKLEDADDGAIFHIFIRWIVEGAVERFRRLITQTNPTLFSILLYTSFNAVLEPSLS